MFSKNFLQETSHIALKLDYKKIELIVNKISYLQKNKGRLFFFGVGGSAANCSHAVNDFRKICLIESFFPFDNISELTARINDEGWETCFTNWLKLFNPKPKDAIFIFSVGGGSVERKVSLNIVDVIKFAISKKMKILGIVGPNGGFAAKSSEYVIKIPCYKKENITPQSESFQAVIWHCIISNPKIKVNKTKW
jgi:D-sedoheptulose 7-phosphate isomerase